MLDDTVYRKVKSTILRPEEEEEIVQLLIDKAKKGVPILRQDVIRKVVEFITSDNRKNPFRNGTPGDKWFSLFRRRHNDRFTELNPKMLRAIEQVGFTEKVTNTVTYHYGGTSLRRRVTTQQSKSMILPARSPPSPVPAVETSPHSEETATTDDGDTPRSQESLTDSTDFQPGIKLEVMDFNEKWYPVKVVEVDYEEGEVLVHFEKWSDRYDEWVSMDSNRIRRPQLAHLSASKKTFEKNEKVIAIWAYNKYPATVRNVLENDKYEVLFCDGYAKILRGCKLFKATEEDLKNVKVPPPKKPAPPMGADPLDPDLGPKEERRLKKRRLDVLEAYLPQNKKPKASTPEPSPPPVSTHKPKEMPKVVLKRRGRMRIKRRERKRDDDDDDDDFGEWADDDDEAEEQEVKPSQTRTRTRTRMKKPKKPFDESTYEYRGPKPRAGFDEDPDRWNMEIPEGVEPVQIKDQEGFYRESIIIPDKKLPPGWTKHTMRRKNGAKWDVFLVNPVGRKFRSRNELRNHFTELKQPFPDDSFDFQVGRKMEMIRSQKEIRKKLHVKYSLSRSSLVHKASSVCKRRRRQNMASYTSADDESPDVRRIRTMMSKSKQGEGSGGEDETAEPSPATPALTSPPFPLTELRTPDGGFTCCGKTFRKENLFQMHMKHYHPEYSNLFGSTPNVADLAYARTVGEPLEDSRAEAMTPRSSLLQRVHKYEAERRAIPPPGPKKIEELESPPATPPVKEDVSSPVVVKTEEPPTTEEEEQKKSEETIEETTPPKVEEVSDVESEEKTDDALSPMAEEMHEEPSDEKSMEPTPPVAIAVEEKPSAEPPVPPTPTTTPPETPTLPVIKPVSKPSSASSKSEAAIVQTTSSAKTPITITKYVPPGQKPVAAITKVTISMTSGADKEAKPTIRTLLPMRPPAPTPEPKDVQDVQKPKETKPKEEAEEDVSNKSRPRKRTVSESLPKKPKLVKPSTGSLEEDPVEAAPSVSPSPGPGTGAGTGNTSYRFSRNRSQVPRVSLEKLNLTPDSNGRVVLASGSLEDKITNTAEVERDQDAGDNGSLANQDVLCDNLRKEEIINCTCGYMEEDGLMIQCDLCLCWQHGLCNNIDKEADVPEKYVCYICRHPPRERASLHHLHNQDWLKDGSLPSLSFRAKDKENIAQREWMLKKSHDLTASMLQLQTVIRSLRVKTHIATKPDHPKLYLWAKSWKNESSDAKIEENSSQEMATGPQPEAAIDETECRLRLLEHVEDYQHQVDDRLTSIQAQIAALESEDPDLASDEASDHYPVTKQTVQMLLRDLQTTRTVAALD